MKKILKIALITTGIILLLLIAIPVLFKSKIEALVKEKVNSEIRATVDWSRFSMTLFRGFPDLSINLHRVSVVGEEPFEGDTLAYLERFELRVNPFSAIGKDIQVKSVLLDRPLVSGIMLEDGRASWDIAAEKDASGIKEEEDATGTFSVSLQRFAIREGRVRYLDEVAGLDASLGSVDLELKGDFSMDRTDLELILELRGVDAKYGGIRYLREGAFELDLVAAANLVEGLYTLKKNEIRLNGLVLGAEGSVAMLDNGAMDMDLRFFSTETSFQTLLSMVPAIYLKDFETIETSGTLQLEGTLNGIMKDSILPDATLALQVTDGHFAYPGLPREVSDVQISLNVDYRGDDMDGTTISLDRFHLLLGGNPFDATLRVDHPFSDMHVAGEAVGTIDFASIQDVVPMEDITLQGRLQSDLRWDTRMSYIELEQYDQVDLDGKLLIEEVRVRTPELAVPLDLNRLEMVFNPRTVELTGLDIVMGSSDLHMDGELSNFIPYVFDDQTISGVLNVRSRLLDANAFLPEETAEQDETVGSDTDSAEPGDGLAFVEAAPDDSLAVPVQLKIPENISFRMNLDMDRVTYDRFDVENITGILTLSGGVARLEGMSLDALDGHVNVSGEVDTRGEFAEADLEFDMKEVDIPSSYETFITVERLAPMARYCRGTANITMQYHSLLGASFVPLYGSIDADGRVYTRDLQIYNLKSFVQISELLKNEKFRQMAPDEVDIGLTVRDGRVMVDPFDIHFDDSRITVSGSHGIDLTMDYLLDMQIAKSDLGGGAVDLMNSMAALASGAGFRVPQSDFVKVKATIRGTFNDPVIRTDLSGNLRSSGETAREAVEERVTEEVEKVEEQVREEVSDRAQQIIRDAGEEAGRLIEEAQKRGDALVKEAEDQGEKLVEEAGSNPLRQAAARRAAEELKRQAEKQSENLVNEAREKADQLIEKARAEAERI